MKLVWNLLAALGYGVITWDTWKGLEQSDTFTRVGATWACFVIFLCIVEDVKACVSYHPTGAGDSERPASGRRCSRWPAEARVHSVSPLNEPFSPRNPAMDATDLTDDQLAYLREQFDSLLDGWRSDFRIPWHKTHRDLVNQLAAMIWGMHRDGVLTVNTINHKEPAGQGGV